MLQLKQCNFSCHNPCTNVRFEWNVSVHNKKVYLSADTNCSDVGLTTCFNYLFQNLIVYPPTHTGILFLLITSLMTDTFSKHLE